MITAVQFQISELMQELFSPYGRILEPQNHEVPEVSESEVFDFYVTFKEPSQDWQIGYLKQTGRIIDKLECHPNTAEVFSPVISEYTGYFDYATRSPRAGFSGHLFANETFPDE